jgi:hypothetical protein
MNNKRQLESKNRSVTYEALRLSLIDNDFSNEQHDVASCQS